MQETGAIHALDSSDRNVGIAPLAGLGHSRGIGIVGLGRVHFTVADLFLLTAHAPGAEPGGNKDNQEQGNGNKEKVDGRHNESTNVLSNSAGSLGLLRGAVWLLLWVAILDNNEPVVQVGTYCLRSCC